MTADDPARLNAALRGIAERWAEARGLPPEGVHEKHVASMREDGIDLDIAAALRAVNEYDRNYALFDDDQPLCGENGHLCDLCLALMDHDEAFPPEKPCPASQR